MEVHGHEQLIRQIEALIYASEMGIGVTEIRQVLTALYETEIAEKSVIEMLDTIKNHYLRDDRVLELRHINGGYQFLTKPVYYDTVNQLQAHRSRKKLSPSALETLAIIAYRQPITKLEIEQIRGVNCDYSVHRLLEKELITISGKADTLGKPLLYATSELFMDHFGIATTADLPKLKDIVQEENTIGDMGE